MKRNRFRTAAWIPIGGWFLVVLFAYPAAADVLVHRNLDDLARQARRIFAGTCTAVTMVSADVEGLGKVSYAEYEFAVTDWIKGWAKEGKFAFRQLRPGGQSPLEGSLMFGARSLRSSLVAAPEYTAGKKYVLFLYDDDEFGFAAPVGSIQGVFHSEGDAVLINGLRNLGLFRGMSQVRGITRALAAAREMAKEGSAPQPVPRDLFLSIVRDLVTINSVR